MSLFSATRLPGRFGLIGLRDLIGLSGLLALVACAPVPPQTPAPTPRTPAAAGLAADANTPRPAEQWWREFGDPTLDALVERALSDQPSLAVAAAAI